MFNFTKFSKEEVIIPAVGIHLDVPWELYSKWNCFSKSMVSSALKSAVHLREFLDSESKSEAFILGSLVDCLLLEPDLYDDQYMVIPSTYEQVKTFKSPDREDEIVIKPFNRNSNTCKQMLKDIEASGKISISEQLLLKAQAMVDAVWANKEASKIVDSGKKQVSIVWREPETGVLCKGRFDILGENVITDLKTARDASLEGFTFAIQKYEYFIQAGIYVQALEILTGQKNDFAFIAVESLTDKIALSALYEINYIDETLKAGQSIFRRACEKVKNYDDEKLTGYSKYIEPVSINQWIIERELRG